MYLDYANTDSIAGNIRAVVVSLTGLRDTVSKTPSDYPEGLDVRLVANSDGELWFATGDVQYDTVHGAACETCTLTGREDAEELRNTAEDLVNNVADQLAEQNAYENRHENTNA